MRALPDGQRFHVKSNFVLGCMILGEVVLFVTFVGWITKSGPVFLIQLEPPVYETQHWIMTGAAMMAMLGWSVSALVAVVNSVKQFTVNTLLQSRFSTVYMDQVKIVTKNFMNPDGSLILVNADDLTNPDNFDKMEGLRYFLNYFEYIAVGIRYGDLHEGLLKSSLRGMLCKIVLVAKEYVSAQRQADPKVFEHLEWLYRRWADKDKK